MKTFLKYTFGTIVVYLVVANYTGFGAALGAGATAYQGSVKVLQGRG